MMAQDVAPDTAFVTSLKTKITGRFFADVARWQPAKIEAEFRKIAARPELLAEEELMSNLMFLVRKREIKSLVDDVGRLAGQHALKPTAQISALKTMTALGGERDRALADQMFSQLLTASLKEPGRDLEFVLAAARVGGPETLAVLRRALDAIKHGQQSAERANPPDFIRISQLDKLRSAIDTESFTLNRKLEVLALPESSRALEMTGLYLRRAGYLAYWSYKELVDPATPGEAAGVRRFLKERAETLIPKSAVGEKRATTLADIRLRGLCLLEAMKQAEPAEIRFLEQNKAIIDARPEFFRPSHDWEDVLDRL